MRKIVLLFILFILFFVQDDAFAQDPQYSQFYAAPLYLNPAFAGSAQMARVGINYRNQWPQISEANFETFSVYFDNFFAEYNSGGGIIITTDKEGFAGLRSTTIGLQYSYQLKIADKVTFVPGTQVAFNVRDLDFSKLTFGSQFDPNTGTFDPNLPTEPGLANSNGNVTFFDIAFGGLLYT